MAGIIRVNVTVSGLRGLRQHASGDSLIASPFRTAMEDSAARLLSAAKGAAPVAAATLNRTGGGTRDKFRARVQNKPMPMWLRVETTQTRSSAGYRNYSYPKRVEWDPKMRHAGWLRNVLVRQQGGIESELGVCARKIERVWESNGE